jgi:LemA protein
MKTTIVMCLTMMCAAIISGCGLFDQGINKYDTLVDKDEAAQQAWGDIDAQLQRRTDLIPSLVSTVKGYAAHERATLDEVIQARASATQMKLEYKQGMDDFSDPAKMAQFQTAQGGLSQALGKLMMVQEAYPDLKANEQFNNLMVQLEGTENRVLQARRVYNAAVASYNTELRHVSGIVINKITGLPFKPRVYFGTDDSARVAPKVDFSTK